MRPLRTFTIEPLLPQALEPLAMIAENIWWSWNHDAQDIFRRLDSDLWEATHHNPVAMLGQIDQFRLEEVSKDAGYVAQLQHVAKNLEEYMAAEGWWVQKYGKNEMPEIAYFCAEFGLTECLPIYSGGLGVLAGDHMKSASELDLPLVGVGLLYQQGYFRQRLNADGWQLELFPRNDFHNLPVELVSGSDGQPLKISVEFPDRNVMAQIWQVIVGRISIFLMDTNVPENMPDDRRITSQLYGGDHEIRVQQEIILGIGGVRMLMALGIQPKAFHMNEGHSAFLTLERIRVIMQEKKISFAEAREAVAASSIFTTHTPVPAGNDAFEPWLVEKYFSHYVSQLGMGVKDLLNMGRLEPFTDDTPLNMTILALRTSCFHNGVSLLHAEVSREMWKKTWPALPKHEVPIDGIVNGIHTHSWVSRDISSLFDRYLGPDWRVRPYDQSVWKRAYNIPDEEIWRTHERRRERLVAFARRHMIQMLSNRGAGKSEIEAASEILDPEALTIGFARRFATYKRANLLFSDIERLKHILKSSGRRVQIIFAGKAHPKDTPGKELIRQIIHIARDEFLQNSIVFLEDYDMNVARYLVEGVDVWLNTPRRPMEASGTSGMKAAANGALNLSIPDGWWAEGYSPQVGWSIGSGEMYEDEKYQDEVESRALYDLLEKEVIPLFYDRGKDNLPRQWIAMMKNSIGRLAPLFSTNRMVRQYADMYYKPAMNNWQRLSADEFAGSKELSGWKRKVRDNFNAVRIESVHDNIDKSGVCVGGSVKIDAVIVMGNLGIDDLDVELYYGRLDSEGQIENGISLTMMHTENLDNSRHRYLVDMPCGRSGQAGYTVRVVPGRNARCDTFLGDLVRWA
ncbi:MAG TPA: alpha-glucan family phosphorylase [Phycisphaerae bacterium]|nr:alpha-glucan family phosphorylase [Phycisphaerae bacterium]